MSQTISTSSLSNAFCSGAEQAHSLLLLGQMELAQNNLEKGLEYFKEASLLKPDDAKIHFEQGLSLFNFGMQEEDGKTLLHASKKFKIAVTLVPEHFEAWHFWGMSLLRLGKIHQEFHYFIEANKKLTKALEHSKDKSNEVMSLLYSEYAIANSAIAENSKEAYDWRLSIEAFEKSVSITPQKSPDFWNEFGLACLQLSELIVDIKLCIQAIHCFKQAISYDAHHFVSWKNLSLTMQSLYKQTQDEDHFTQANQCFEASQRMNPSDLSISIDWALFLIWSGKITLDLKKLSSCIEKCKKAYVAETQNPELLATWGEALALTGELTENIELIHSGQAKLDEALDIDSSVPSTWRAFGESFNSLGKYFDDQDYYYQAIEKFQTGLSIDRTEHELWMATGNTYLLIGKMLEDTVTLKKALYFMEKATDLQPHISHYHFTKAHCLSKLGEISREETYLEASINTFEKALSLQKNAIYLHPNWLFEYAKALDLYADFFDEEQHYHKAIEIFLHVLMINPEFSKIHHHLGLTYSHLAELSGEIQNFYRALHFFRLAAKREEDNDQILVDLAVTFINIAQHTGDTAEIVSCYQEAESKLFLAVQAGSLQAYYQLACLYSLLNDAEKSIIFLAKTNSFSALPSIEDILEDEWLDHVRRSDSFKEFLLSLEKKTSLQEES
ncbi:MAG: hypothetical protein V4489_08300 [Chlamydiota bacterium]